MCLRFALLVVLVGCAPGAPSVVPVAGPEGQGGWLQVTCPRAPRKCRELAADTCPGGYDVQQSQIGGASRYNSPSAMDEPIGPPEKNGQMFITCKSGSAPNPTMSVRQ